jgi:hypothetical protein
MWFYFLQPNGRHYLWLKLMSMENKNLKIWLAIIVGIISIQLLVNVLFVSPRLKQSLERLEEAQQHLNSVRDEVQYSRKEIDSIRLNLMKFNNYVIAIQGRTEILFKEKAFRDAKFKTQRDSIQLEMKMLHESIDTISLPPLKIYDTRK